MAKFQSRVVFFLFLGMVLFHQAGAQGPVPAPSSGADVPVSSTPVAPVPAPVAPVVTVTPDASPVSTLVVSTPTPATIPIPTLTPSASPIPTPTHSPTPAPMRAVAPTSEAPAPGPSSAISAGTRQVWSGMALVSALAAVLVL